MGNRVDFYQKAEGCAALPAASVSVFVDGAVCSELEPVEIVRRGWPGFGYARLVYNPAADVEDGCGAVEQLERRWGMGRSVSIRAYFNGAWPEVAVESWPIFAGRIEGFESRVGPEGPEFELIVKDCAAQLRRICVYGQRVLRPDGGLVRLTGLETVFNPQGRPNASSLVAICGRRRRVFCAESSDASWWTYGQVLGYLLYEFVPAGLLVVPSTEQLEGLAGEQVVRDLDVTGLDLVEALQRCCEPVGLAFRFVPSTVESGPAEAIEFYRPGQGRSVQLNLQEQGEVLEVRKSDIARLRRRGQVWPVTHRYIGQGDFKVYEATFELVKAWDPGLEGTDYERFCPSSNPQFYQVKDVYRKWCLNEAGDYSVEPYNQGEAFDFSKIFEGAEYVRRRRRFWPCLSRDAQGNSLGYFVEVSFDGGEHWWQYSHAFNVLLDECGIWLSSDRLDVDTWVAALKGLLRFRITASVVSDERLGCVLADGPVGSTVPVVDRLILLPRRFRYRRVSPASIFANRSDTSLGLADEADDSESLRRYVRTVALASASTVETIEVQTPSVAFGYEVGDVVRCAPQSRDVLGCRAGRRTVCWIEQVRMDFRQQCTQLRLVRKAVVQL